MGGSCAHPDQSWDWLSAQRSDDLGVGASSPILLFFIMGGVPLHDCLGQDDVESIERGVLPAKRKRTEGGVVETLPLRPRRFQGKYYCCQEVSRFCCPFYRFSLYHFPVSLHHRPLHGILRSSQGQFARTVGGGL